jgi:pimeloyl-ACP methyl ester carboxylesterase
MADPSGAGEVVKARQAALVRRAVTTAGRADAPPLVLLHGTRRTRAMWRLQLHSLADAFRVIAVDLPGHGALADVHFRLADASDLVAAVIDEIAGGRAIVIGSSMGGYVAMDLAARQPERVAGLVLANATAEPRSIARRAPRTVGSYLVVAAGELLPVPPGRGAGRDGPADDPGPGSADATAAPEETAAPEAPEMPPGPVTAAGAQTPATGRATNGWLFKGGTRALVAALGMSFIPRLAAYPGPTLIVNGEDDGLFRREEGAFLAAARNGRLVVIPGTGHLVNEEQPAAFDAAVRRFAAEVAGAGPPQT